MIPGEYKLAQKAIQYNAGRESTDLKVKNTAYCKRLDIPAGTAVRFEPGDEKVVNLIDIAGVRRVYGLNNKVDGYLDEGGKR